jgi:outer membrane protein assembly factor BamB
VVGGGNTVYIADIRKLYAIDSAGVLQWKYELGSAGMVSPAITQDGTIIVSSMINADPYPHVIDALYPDGTLKWRYTLTSDQTITSAPTIAPDGTIYIGSTSNPILYAFNPDGTLKWTAPTYTPDCTVPAIGADGTIFVGCSFGLSAFNPDGTDKWTAGMTDHVSASVTVDPGGNTYLGSWGAAGQFRAMDPAGTLNWWWDLDIACTAALGVDGTIYLQTDFNLIAFNPDGSVKWNILNDLERGSAIAIGEDSTLYISGAWNGNGCGIKAYDSSGIEKWHWETPSGTYFTSPVIGQDGLIFVGFGKALYCFGP